MDINNNEKVSVVIPSRNEIFLYKTVCDILAKARGDIEVIVMLDGYYPDAKEIITDNRVHYIHRGESYGMRNGINTAVAVSTGKYIMKLDAHCMLDEGFDIKLKQDIEHDWVSVPTRKRLDAENWCLQEVDKPDINYMYLSFPDDPADFGGAGLNGKVWDEKNKDPELKGKLIDDLMSAQGSCWFMHKDYFYKLELMDEDSYGHFWNEFQEIGLKCWLSGGRVIRNKKTWYAHLHKGKTYGRGYFLSKGSLTQGAEHTKKWMVFKEAWDKQTLPIEYLITKFYPVPGWNAKYARFKLDNFDSTNYILDKYSIKAGGRPHELNITRDDLAKLFCELGYKTGVEIGVERGAYSKVLCEANPEAHVTGVDPLQAYGGYREHVSQERLDGFYNEVMDKMKPHNYSFIRKFSLDAVREFGDNSLDFVYINGNHDFQNTTNDIAEWSKKVRVGGIVAGHDFTRNKKKDYKCHVKDVVQAWTYANDIRTWFITRADKSPSWFYVKGSDGQ